MVLDTPVCAGVYLWVTHVYYIVTLAHRCQWWIHETGKGGSKLSSAKREELNPRKVRTFWGYAHFRCSKTRENPILSQGKSHLRLRGTAANSQLASLG